MPLHERSISGTIAVVCFFAVGLVGWLTGLSPYVCSKRALAGAVMGYVGGSLAVKAVNAVLTSALIDHLTKSQEGRASDNKT
jgi:translation initiation factor 2 gamma subunit (eIF-2gamma)